VSGDYGCKYDAATLRVKSRVAVACPAPQATIRKLAVGP
jgi:hypothetical protein